MLQLKVYKVFFITFNLLRNVNSKSQLKQKSQMKISFEGIENLEHNFCQL